MSLQRQLTLKEGIPLAFGSIMGSGILFLPALTYSIAGKSVIWAWLIATGLCIPLLFVFQDMFERVDSAEGIGGYISLASPRLAKSIPYLFLGTVSLGMPSAALIAGNYLSQALRIDHPFLLASLIPLIACGTTSFDVKFGARAQTLITVVLVLISAALFSVTSETAMKNLDSTAFTTFEFKPVFLAVVAAFWAFAGFENISFMAGEFKNPRRDLFLSCVIALVICGILYLGLTMNYSLIVDHDKIDMKTGLLQLAIHPAIRLLVGIFAYLSVLLNFNAWVWGLSRMVSSTAERGGLPKFLASLNASRVPLRAVVSLTLVFEIVLGLAIIDPLIFSRILMMVSANFVVIYILAVGAFLKLRRSAAAFLLLAVLLVAIAQTGWLMLYPLAIILVSQRSK